MKKIIEFDGASVTRPVREMAAGRLVIVTMGDDVRVHVARLSIKRKQLSEPAEIGAALQPHLFEQDSIAQFIEEMLDLPEADDNPVTGQFIYKTNNADVYAAYKKFCEQAGEMARTQRRLTQNLKERGFKQQPENGKRVWHGFSLKNLSNPAARS